MNKKTVLYFRSCKYHPDHLKKLGIMFDVIYLDELSDIGYLPRELEKKIWAMLLPPIRVDNEGGFPEQAITKVGYPDLEFLVCNQTNPTLKPSDGISLISLKGKQIRHSLTATAEHTVGLITRLHRSRGAPKKMLSRSHLLIIGYGRLGAMVKDRTDFLFERVSWIDEIESSLDPSGLAKYLGDVDFCSIHADTSDELIGWPEFFALGPDGYLINTARHENVKIQEADTAVSKGIIAGFASDVDSHINPEQVPNCMLTNHIGGSTQDSWYLTQEYVVEELIACT